MSRNRIHSEQQMVRRFTRTFIVTHWLYASSFLALLVTGLPMYTEFFDWLYPVLGGPATARQLHRIFAVVFVVPFLILLVFDRASLKNWLKQILSWKKHDFQFFAAFPKEFFGFHTDMPKQDFFNAGEKLNSILQMFSFLLLILSGVFMWFPKYFPKWLQVWSYPIHDIGFGLAIAVVVGHIYLSIGHPSSRVSIKGMTKGYVPMKYVEEHHGRWADELRRQGK
ncbi:formate dehydrogenase subunit gamma [Effusibacillus lacus]|uniref:Formate dehydrogenase n=1 Tax=Effusibacillus lacus TaxID=1348429 RepID=A0A292YGG8_9BACL|nr:cytochrome b/b6 domain-containing protein [Effusibacillus lacus]TCS71805.1 formate dehydrogenase subunit gamma [Effusibacillus lacus]GAX89627.1 formate dehydrogenase [Effusibacillus lacus]